jgi:hypothetical protein
VFLALSLAALTVVLRWPFRTALLSHWDSVQYALGLHEFNLLHHTPQPPGSPFYILLGRAVSAIVGDDARAFVTISLITSAAAVACGYLYTTYAFGRRAGLLLAAALATQPAFWYYGASGNSWTNLALLSLLVGGCCLGLYRGERRLVWPSAAIIGLASGFRLDVSVFMGPLWLWTLRKAEPCVGRQLAAVALAAACVAAWAVPVVASVGGLMAWLDNYTSMFVPVPGRSDAVVSFAQQTALLWGGAIVAVGPLVGVALATAPCRTGWLVRHALGRDMVRFTATWVLPSFLFLWLTDTTENGHNLLFVCGLLPLVAGLVARAVQDRVLLVGGICVAAVQAGIFLLATPRTQPPFAWTANSILLGFTAPALREQQETLRNAIGVVRARFDPSTTEILTLAGQDVYRFAMYYLPEFTVTRMPEGGHGPMRARNWRPLPEVEPACSSGQVQTAWIVWATTPRAQWPEAAIEVPLPNQSEGTRWRVWVSPACSQLGNVIHHSVPVPRAAGAVSW